MPFKDQYDIDYDKGKLKKIKARKSGKRDLKKQFAKVAKRGKIARKNYNKKSQLRKRKNYWN